MRFPQYARVFPCKAIHMTPLLDCLEHTQFVEHQEHIMDGLESRTVRLKPLLLIIVMSRIAVSIMWVFGQLILEKVEYFMTEVSEIIDEFMLISRSGKPKTKEIYFIKSFT